MGVFLTKQLQRLKLIYSLSGYFYKRNVSNYGLGNKNPGFDSSLYENVLDPAECQQQLSHLRSDPNLRLQFLDAGLRIPKFITKGNTLDMGNYHGCLGIHQALDDNTIQGKYCMIDVPANLNQLKMNEELMEDVKLFMQANAEFLTDDHSRTSILGEGQINFQMAVCIPQACTVQEGLNGLLFNTTVLGFQYEEQFCRLPNDKPWAPADYVAIVIFSLIGLLTILSTLYDLRNRFILRKDPKSVNPLYTSFSAYTNALRLTTINKNPGALECVDGIRVLSVVWVVIGHTYFTLPRMLNISENSEWQLSLSSLWITSSSFAVDTFFMISGLLLVYTSAGKMTSSNLIRNLHLFYLNRILRMLPLLAAAILAQVSFFHWIADGPLWQIVATNTETCRDYWWLSLLYVQNFFSPICHSHTWYLAVDMQMHILSPILLYFVLSSSKRQAWVALVAGLLATLTASTIYVFMKEMSASLSQLSDSTGMMDYMYCYYYNTLTRAAPFLVGMLFGYILHVCRHKPRISMIMVGLLWIIFIILAGLALYSPEPLKDFNYDNQTLENFMNAFSRTFWAIAVACLIVVCVNGYGGPVNWFLSLQMWKLPSRISYSMYLFHYPIMFIITGTYVQLVYFSVIGAIYVFFSQLLIAYIVGFFATIIIDSPFSTIFKHLLGGGLKKPTTDKLSQNNATMHHEDPKGQLKDEPQQ